MLSSDPVVFYTMDWELKPGKGGLLNFMSILHWVPVTILMQTSWIVHNNWHIKHLKHLLNTYKKKHPKHRILVFASDPIEFNFLKKEGVDAHFINQNALLDEKLFKPLPAVPKRFDAIYDARMITYKRHFLAAKIRSLSLFCHNWKDCPPEYAEETRLCMNHAHWYKDPFVKGPVQWFSAEQVNAMINENRCGLCLSAMEGCMYAGTQYLLAGIPVVTTRNKGGRDELFDPKHVRWVDDDPDAVAEAVNEWANQTLDPEAIRQSVLEKMAVHRKAFVELMNRIFHEAGKNEAWASAWPTCLPNKLNDEPNKQNQWLWKILRKKKIWNTSV